MKLIAKASSGLIAIGLHLAKITKAYSVEVDGDGTYKDKTKQLAVVFEAGGKSITRWFNTKGYQIDPENPTRVVSSKSGKEVKIKNYLTDESGKRIEDTENTEACMNALGALAKHAGFEEGDKIDSSDLEGCEIGIFVINEASEFSANGRLRVSYTLDASEVAKTEDVVEEA